MKKHIFIINPKAGDKKAAALIPYIEANFPNCIIKKTKYPKHAICLAKKYSQPNSVIYSLGGDGTINEVVNGVMASGFSKEVIVANIPCGSGNDFIRSFTEEKNPYKILDSYKKFNIKTIDVGTVNAGYFINIASVGFDAEIVARAKKYKNLPLLGASLAYYISALVSLVKLHAYPLSIQIDKAPPDLVEVLFISMANANYYGGGMRSAPMAVIDDGLLDFSIVSCVKRRRLPYLLPRYMKGQHDGLEALRFIRGKQITIKSKNDISLNIDGEVLTSKFIQIGIKEKALRVLIP